MTDTTTVSQSTDGNTSASTDTSTSSVASTTTETKPTTTTTQTTTTPEKKRSLEDIVGEKWDEIAKNKSDEATNPDPKKTGTRTVTTSQKEPTAATTTETKKDVDPLSGRELDPVKVPQSTPASIRDDWAKLPRTWQEYISKRETDMRQQISQLGDAKKFSTELQAEGKVFEDLFKKSDGKINLTTYTKDLYKLAHRLNAGTRQQRAVVIHELIQAFGPDFGVMTALSKGQNPNIPAVQKPIDMDAEVDKRLAQRSQEAAKQQSSDAVQSFYTDSKNEFAQELDDQIAAAINGNFVSKFNKDGTARQANDILKDAYDFALRNSPEHQAILAKRGTNAGQQQQTNNPQAGKEPVRQAAPSPGGGKPVKTAPKHFKNAEAAASDAWDQVMSRKK